MVPEISFIKNMVSLRNSSRENLPMGDSLIAYDLILYIAITYVEEQHITIKQLFSSLPHSYTAIRQHYNRLLIDGYVIHKSHPHDKRVKYIEPTEKFITSVVSYANSAHIILGLPPPPTRIKPTLNLLGGFEV